MELGKHLRLEEARKQLRLNEFCKEHPSEGDGGEWEHPLRLVVMGDNRISMNNSNV